MKCSNETSSRNLAIKFLGMSFIAASILASCATLPNDGATASVKHFGDLRAMRYCEVFLIGGNALTKDLKAAFYNTTDLNGQANSRDACPAGLWDKVDAEALKKQYDVLGVFKNGPRTGLSCQSGLNVILMA